MHALKEIKRTNTLQIQAADSCRLKKVWFHYHIIMETSWSWKPTCYLHSNDTKMDGIIATPTYGTDREKDSKNVPNSR